MQFVSHKFLSLQITIQEAQLFKNLNRNVSML